MSAVSGELNSQSLWVTFKDRTGVTRTALRAHVRRSPSASREVLLDNGLGSVEWIQTQLTYDEIMGG